MLHLLGIPFIRAPGEAEAQAAYMAMEGDVLAASSKDYRIVREQLIDLAILIGTDFNSGVKGIGPKTALSLIKQYGALENLPKQIRDGLPENFNEIRQIFLHPEITSNYSLSYGKIQKDEIYEFLCNQRDFSKEKVEVAINRMKNFYKPEDKQS